MKPKDPSHSHRILPFALWSLFILILLSLSVASDQIPEISIEAVPSHVGIDTTDQKSNKSCIYVHVISKYSCELITLDDTQSEKVIALRLTSKRLHQDKDGIIGYPAHCCKDEGFCYDLEINTTTCNKTRGNFPFPDYRVLEWDPNETTIEGMGWQR